MRAEVSRTLLTALPDSFTQMEPVMSWCVCVCVRAEKELATPPLDGIILPGVTRQSLLDLAREWVRHVLKTLLSRCWLMEKRLDTQCFLLPVRPSGRVQGDGAQDEHEGPAGGLGLRPGPGGVRSGDGLRGLSRGQTPLQREGESRTRPPF